MKNAVQNSEEIAVILDWMRLHAPQAQLRSDSRLVEAGDVFFAFPIPSAKGDGRRHIQSAIERGAAAIVYEECDEILGTHTVPQLAVRDLIQQLGTIANAWYEQPDQGMLSVAVTGTNGKTSCSQWIANALSQARGSCAVIGTLGIGQYRSGQLMQIEETGFTTPDALQLQARLQELKTRGVPAFAMEASSIGLHQGRMNGMHVDIALLTNLSRDHLDYHQTMEAYAACKQALFDWQGLKHAVVNLDDAFGSDVVQHMQQQASAAQILGYGIGVDPVEGVALLNASQLRTTQLGTQFFVESPFGNGTVKTRLIGRFNVSNVLGVMGVLLAQGIAWDKTVAIIEKLNSVPGRMQQLGSSGQVMVVVDYAHTPDALEKTIDTLLEVVSERQGELWCVFGCGGDRDPGKRPQMGRIAQKAHQVVVTSDNPRTENPTQIIQDIVAGMQGTPLQMEDRASAILYAVKHAQANDVVLIAGKGHEDYQDIQGKKWPFSDEQHALLALATIATNSSMRRNT